MTNIEKEIRQGKYYSAYNDLNKIGYVYSIENLMHDLPHINSMEKYCFLMYAISRNETSQLHMSICELLMFDPFFHYVYPLVYWHIQKAIILSPSDYTIKEWVLDTFSSSPDSPFTDEELYDKASKYNLIDETEIQFDRLNDLINVEKYKEIISNLLKCQINIHYADNESYPEESGCDLKYDGKTYGEYIILKNGGFEVRKRELFFSINETAYDNPIFLYRLYNDRIFMDYLTIKYSFFYNLSEEEFDKIIEDNSIERYERKFKDRTNTYVSIREFCEAIGYKVEYEESSNTIILTN